MKPDAFSKFCEVVKQVDATDDARRMAAYRAGVPEVGIEFLRFLLETHARYSTEIASLADPGRDLQTAKCERELLLAMSIETIETAKQRAARIIELEIAIPQLEAAVGRRNYLEDARQSIISFVPELFGVKTKPFAALCSECANWMRQHGMDPSSATEWRTTAPAPRTKKPFRVKILN